MGGNVSFQTVGDAADVLALEEVAHCCTAGQVNVLEVDAHMAWFVSRVVESHCADGSETLLDVFHKHVCFTFVLNYIGLEAEGILVEGDEVAVGHKVEGLRAKGGHIAAD